MRVLVVEDDPAVGSSLVEGLGVHGIEVSWVTTGAEALAAPPADLVLLDLGLPDQDGLDVCRQLRAAGSRPIIVLTARGEETDRVLGLELGADDYMVKPFGLRELVARIRAVSRRAAPAPGGQAASEKTASETVLGVGNLSVDTRTRRVSVGGEEVELTPKEFDLLALLAADPGAVRSRTEIIETVWDPHWWGPTKTLDVHVASLRRKLGDRALIETVKGVGYRLRAAAARP
ncbi:MAG: response regulator transcription factor [Acidimicrobiales bacterium]